MTRVTFAGLGLVVLALLVGLAATGGLTIAFDRAIMTAVSLRQGVSSDTAIGFARALTDIGDARLRALFVLAAVAALVARRRARRAAAYVAAVGLTVFANSVLKELFARERPSVVPHLVPVADLSFPSGHAESSMIVFLLAALLLGSRIAVAAALALALAIGLSRVLLGVHYPSDVLGGWLFGGGCALLGLRFAVAVERPRPALGAA